MDNKIHYELYIRKSATAGWTLELATEDRLRAISAADEALADKRAVAVRVCKETLDEDTREFRSVSILTKGMIDTAKAKAPKEALEPLCSSPDDLYTAHARDRIGELLETWLARARVSPYELLHRPDLVEQLEATGVELQHAIQKVAVPEAQARGLPTHDMMRHFQSLSERAIARLLKDHRAGAVLDFDKEPFAEACERLAADPDRAYRLGGGVARAMAAGKTWRDKLSIILDLADKAPQGAGRALALQVLEQPLMEMIGARSALADILGQDLDLGSSLTALTRIAGAEAVDAVLALDPQLATALPPLIGPAARLANWLDGPHFPGVRAAIARRVLHELRGPRRLRPRDPEAEIKSLRLLAMALTATAGRILSLDDIQAAFAERSKTLTASDFVGALTQGCGGPRLEGEALIRLAENVTGAVAKRQAARWLASTFGALRFEREFRESADTPIARLAHLASLQRGVLRARLIDDDANPLLAKLGEVGAYVEADAKLAATLARSSAPLVHRLDLLTRMAAGEAAPSGPAADRARAEALKLARLPEAWEVLERSPDLVAMLRALVTQSAAAATAKRPPVAPAQVA